MLHALMPARRRPAPAVPVRFRPRLYITSTWRPPQPLVEKSPVPWKPPYADLVIAQVLRRYGDNPADIARRWLREAAEQAHAGTAAAR